MYIIIGQGAAGTAAAKALRGFSPQAPILMLSCERESFYNRIELPAVIAGETEPQAITVHDEAYFADLGIQCRLGESVKSLDTEGHILTLVSGERLTYRKLLLATGSVPAVPPVDGLDGPGVYSLWTLEDARAIRKAAEKGGRAVVIGAGLIGLKSALALNCLGLDVTVVEREAHIMPRQLDETAAALVAKGIQEAGVILRTGCAVRSVSRKGNTVTALVLDDGPLPCDFIVTAVGVRPNARLAREAGLDVGRGILVDGSGRTSDPDVYAAGDVAEIRGEEGAVNRVPAIWPVAVEQGRAAAAAMTGNAAPEVTSVAMNSVEFAGVPVASVGDITEREGDAVLVSEQNGAYQRLVLHGNVPRGVLCVGDISRIGVLGNCVARQTPLPACDPLAAHFSFGDLLFPGTRKSPSPMEYAHAN